MIFVYGVILSNATVPLNVNRKFPVVLAVEVQWPLIRRGAEAERLSMAVRRAMMVSLMGRARMACSSTSLLTPPRRMTVILVAGGVLDCGEVFRPRFFCWGGGVVLVRAAA